MNLQHYQPKHIFTLEEANRTLPLVGAITRDMAKLSVRFANRRERYSDMRKLRGDPTKGDVYSDELVAMKEKLLEDEKQILDYVKELEDLGVEAKNAPQGLVDFPCKIDGQLAYLCWKLGEEEILYWHTLEGGFAGRQHIKAAETEPSVN